MGFNGIDKMEFEKAKTKELEDAMPNRLTEAVQYIKGLQGHEAT